MNASHDKLNFSSAIVAVDSFTVDTSAAKPLLIAKWRVRKLVTWKIAQIISWDISHSAGHVQDDRRCTMEFKFRVGLVMAIAPRMVSFHRIELLKASH